MKSPDSINGNRSPHASLGNDEADQAGPFFSVLPLAPHTVEEEALLRKLAMHGYYRFRVYWLALLQTKSPSDNDIRCEEVLEVMHFDEELTNFILSLIAPVELAFRAIVAQSLIEHAGEYALDQAQLFANDRYYSSMKSILAKEYARAKKDKRCPAPQGNEDAQSQPSWILLEIASFGTISKLYCNLAESRIRKDIAKAFGVKPYLLENWMRCLTILRNVCAHNGYLYSRTFNVRPALFKEHAGINKSSCFAYLLLLTKLQSAVRPDETAAAHRRLQHIIKNHKDVDLSQLGFPENWKDLLGIPVESESIRRKRGTNGGRPPKDPQAIEEALYLYDLKTDSIAEISRKTGVGTTTLYKYIKLRKETR